MNIALWVVQGVLGAAFLIAGTMKLVAYEKFKAQTAKGSESGVGRELATFIGLAEVAGGIGIVLPMAIHTVPVLTIWAAAGLALFMLLTIGFLVRRHESPVAPVIFLLLTAFVAAGRFFYPV